MNQHTDPVVQMLDAYKAAAFAKDIEAFVTLYDDDVHVFDMWETWSIRGIEAWRTMISEWFSSLGSERVIVGIDDAQSTVVGTLAVGHAVLTYTAVSAEGKALRLLSNRITVVMKYTGTCWKVIHEHTSAPVNHQTLKAILQYADGN